VAEQPNVARTKAADMSKERRQQITKKAEAAKQKADDRKQNPKDHPPK
jgi:hypothetical protein